MVLALETLDPQVIGLTNASRPSTLRIMPPKSALYKRMQWMQSMQRGNDEEDDA